MRGGRLPPCKGGLPIDSKLEKWLRWFDVIEKDIQQLLIRQHIFREISEGYSRKILRQKLTWDRQSNQEGFSF